MAWFSFAGCRHQAPTIAIQSVQSVAPFEPSGEWVELAEDPPVIEEVGDVAADTLVFGSLAEISRILGDEDPVGEADSWWVFQDADFIAVQMGGGRRVQIVPDFAPTCERLPLSIGKTFATQTDHCSWVVSSPDGEYRVSIESELLVLTR